MYVMKWLPHKVKTLSVVSTKWFTVLPAAFVLLAVCSCSPRVRYVPVETVKHDSVYLNSARVDSVFVKDSTFVFHKGDTVTEYRYKYVYKYRDRTDTAYVTRQDTIRVPYPVEVEKRLTLWQHVKVQLGGVAMAGFVLLVVVGCLVYRLRR